MPTHAIQKKSKKSKNGKNRQSKKGPNGEKQKLMDNNNGDKKIPYLINSEIIETLTPTPGGPGR
jgi:hypothetical protein